MRMGGCRRLSKTRMMRLSRCNPRSEVRTRESIWIIGNEWHLNERIIWPWKSNCRVCQKKVNLESEFCQMCSRARKPQVIREQLVHVKLTQEEETCTPKHYQLLLQSTQVLLILMKHTLFRRISHLSRRYIVICGHFTRRWRRDRSRGIHLAMAFVRGLHLLLETSVADGRPGDANERR